MFYKEKLNIDAYYYFNNLYNLSMEIDIINKKI